MKIFGSIYVWKILSAHFKYSEAATVIVSIEVAKEMVFMGVGWFNKKFQFMPWLLEKYFITIGLRNRAATYLCKMEHQPCEFRWRNDPDG